MLHDIIDRYFTGKNDELCCKPSIRLCTNINDIPTCKKGGVWMKQNFNDDADSWKIITPLITSQGRKNCCFEIYEFKDFSKQGRYKIIKPGVTEDIFWKIRSLKISNEKCT